MLRLEDIRVGSRVIGVAGDKPVTAVQVEWFGNYALTLTYKTEDNVLGSLMLYLDMESDLSLATDNQWTFDADADELKLVSEAYRINLAHLFDPYLAVRTSAVEPLPHQISAVYKDMLPQMPLRFVLADDPGAGKTIMAGLLIKEMLARGDLKRCMIVCPGNLVEQWQDELYRKFGLTFTILTNDLLNAAVTRNAFKENDLMIARLDQLSRNEDIQALLREVTWDLVVCDEAHKMSATVFGGEARYSYTVRLLRRLAELDGTWRRPNVVTFYHEYDKYGFLSNWYEAPFEFHGNTFPTTEHWMMWQKARLFGDDRTARAILDTADLDEVKRLGRQVKPYVDAAWREARLPVMRVGLRQKFAQNERLLNELLSTGSAVLAEVAPNDTIWGVGIGSDDSRASDPAEWHGQNLLGRLLMEVRSELRVMPPSGKQATAWSGEGLMRSQLWDMSLLELARMPSTRPAAIMYATYAAQHVPHFRDAHDVLREVRASICGIDESMRLNMGEGLPIAGWRELIDELSLRAYLDGHETRTAGFVVGEEPPRSVRKSTGHCSRE